jgi:hypothetical protein
VKLAFPEAFKEPLPNMTPPFLNVTEPEGVPPPDELTFALNVTDWPDVEGFTLDVIVTAVGNFTACERVV